jgi:shikimate kinase
VRKCDFSRAAKTGAMLECAEDSPRPTVNTTSNAGDSKPLNTIIALTGFMGSGKTSTGRALAELLGWEFIDLDEEIERRHQVSIRELFRERGEAAFRKIEHEVLLLCLTRCSGPMVLALGGGAFVQPDNVKFLNASEVRTVFLETPVDEMLARCGMDDESGLENARPLAADSAAFRKLYAQRLPFYRAAQLTFDTSGKTIAEVASEISKTLQLDPIQ